MKKRQYAYQFRLQLTQEQTVQIVQSAGCVRKVWNYFLAKIEQAEEKYKAKLKAEFEVEQAKLEEETSTEKIQSKIKQNTSDGDILSKKQSQDVSEKTTKNKIKLKTKSYKGYHHYAGLLTKLKAKKKYAYLNNCPSQALQQTLKNLDKGFKRFFKKEAEHPVFKKKAKYKAIHFLKGINYFLK